MSHTIAITKGYEGGYVRCPVNALKDERLTSNAKVLLMLLINESEVQQDCTVVYPYWRAMEELDVASERTVKAAFDLLKAHGFIDEIVEKTALPHPGTNRTRYRTTIRYVVRLTEDMEFWRPARSWEIAVLS
jgi:hypothetical protein